MLSAALCGSSEAPLSSFTSPATKPE